MLLFIGSPGSGKSSLICHLCGVDVKAAKYYGNYILSHNEGSKYPKIDSGIQAEKIIPNYYFLNKEKSILLYEPPGFLDTRVFRDTIGIHQ